LAKNFPEKAGNAAVLVPGPTTGAFKEYHPPVADSGPHGLVMDGNGNVWFTANFKAYIGKLDPKTGTFTEYKLDPSARDPHTPIFDRTGNLWFTAQGANIVGRTVPKTGEVKLVTVPTPRANPYGMVVDSHDVPWFVEFGSNKIASIDAVTMAVHEYPLPNAGARPRRIAIDGNDVMWYSDYARGYLGRFDPKTGSVTEWPSPGGAGSQPYGIAYLKNAVWYSESGVKPNTLVRFDPQTKKFQTWIIPSGGGVVRNMMPTTDGKNLYKITSTYPAEGWGTWARGAMQIVLPRRSAERRDDGNLQMRLELVSLLGKSVRDVSSVRIAVNGETVAQIDERLAGTRCYDVPIPAALAAGRPQLVVEIEGSSPAKPRSIGLNDDRELTVGVVSLSIDRS
jgi:streptogramin lyase